jgi:TolB-like protein
MAAFLSRIRFGSERPGPGLRNSVMEDVQLPEGPSAGDIVPIAGEPGAGREGDAEVRVTEEVVVPEQATGGRGVPFRLMPGGATRDWVEPDGDAANRVAEAIIVPASNSSPRSPAMPNEVAPFSGVPIPGVPVSGVPVSGVPVSGPSSSGMAAWAMPRRSMPDAPFPAADPPAGIPAGVPAGVKEIQIVPTPPPPGPARSGGQTTGIPRPGRKGPSIRGAEQGTEANSGKVEGRQSRSTLRLGVREMRVIGPNADAALAVGLAEEVITALSRFRWISCVSGASLAAIAGETGEAGVYWADLDLDLLLDGTIQHDGKRVRITVRLMDMRAGEAVIWANRFDHDAADTLTVQDLVASAIVAQMDPLLLMREGERAAMRNPRGITARDLVLQAVPAIYRMDRLSFHAAGELLEAALRSEPTHTDALAWFAYWHLFLVGQGWTDEPDAATRRAGELADMAVAMDPNDARALTLASHVRAFLLKRPAEAAALHDRAIALNPNLAIAWCFSGFALSYLGYHEVALVRMTKAIELSPSDPHLFFFHAAVIMPHLLLCHYQEAVAAGRPATELNPWFSSGFKGYLSGLGHLGVEKEAANVLARLLKLEPNFTVQDAIRRSPMTVAADIERYAEGLRRAGLREG